MIAPYLDASTIIYLIEGTAGTRRLVAARIAAAERDPLGRLMTSELSRLECRVKPLGDGNLGLVATYDAFFARPRLAVLDLTALVIDRATELRARYRFKTPDAIHLASALAAGADGFVTGDRDLVRCKELNVEIVSPTVP